MTVEGLLLAIKYKDFIKDNFYLKTKEGKIIPFLMNEVQASYYDTLETDYPDMQGIRENILKGRQFGISTMWTGIFMTDFILSALGDIDYVNSDIYSYKDEDTKSHFDRVNMFLDSWLLKTQGGDYAIPEHRLELPRIRSSFLKVDTTNHLVSKNGTEIMTKTAGAKVSGRGGTKQNIHWTEPAFYNNTEILSAKQLMTGAEEQVPQGFGKIVRESTGNIAGNYYATEYEAGKDGLSEFKSRFIAWYSFKQYQTVAPDGFEVPEYYAKLFEDGKASVEQIYWHFLKTRKLKDKEKLREYPSVDREAFLYGGSPYFDADALLYYTNNIKEPIKETEYATYL